MVNFFDTTESFRNPLQYAEYMDEDDVLVFSPHRIARCVYMLHGLNTLKILTKIRESSSTLTMPCSLLRRRSFQSDGAKSAEGLKTSASKEDV